MNRSKRVFGSEVVLCDLYEACMVNMYKHQVLVATRCEYHFLHNLCEYDRGWNPYFVLTPTLVYHKIKPQ